jgi:predicted DNA-binding transcriptional regulator AlpA
LLVVCAIDAAKHWGFPNKALPKKHPPLCGRRSIFQMQDKANSRRNTAALLGISQRTLDRIMREPDGLKAVRVSDRRVVFFDSAIEDYKQRKLVEAQEGGR